MLPLDTRSRSTGCFLNKPVLHRHFPMCLPGCADWQVVPNSSHRGCGRPSEGGGCSWRSNTSPPRSWSASNGAGSVAHRGWPRLHIPAWGWCSSCDRPCSLAGCLPAGQVGSSALQPRPNAGGEEQELTLTFPLLFCLFLFFVKHFISYFYLFHKHFGEAVSTGR